MAEAPRRGLAIRNQNEMSLVRQVGKSSLLDPLKEPMKHLPPRPPPRAPPPKENSFEVFQDPASPEANDENNLIHILEKKCRQEAELKRPSPRKAVAKRRPLGTLRQGPSSTSESFKVYESDDEETSHSLLSQSSLGTFRAELTGLSVVAHKEEVEQEREVALEPEIDEDALYASPEFDSDIYAYMRKRETIIRAKFDYLKRQGDITVEMRQILVDWLSDIVTEYNMSQETLHLSVSILDRSLSKIRIGREKLQLLGAVSFMIAAKFEEVYPLTPKDLVYLTEDSYRIKEMLEYERAVLGELRFDVCAPTACWFANRLKKVVPHITEAVECAMEYLLDLSLVDPAFIVLRPSFVGAACLSYALILFGLPAWSSELEKFSGIQLQHLQKAYALLHKMFLEAPIAKQRSIYNRYSEPLKLEVSTLQAPHRLPTSIVEPPPGFE